MTPRFSISAIKINSARTICTALCHAQIGGSPKRHPAHAARRCSASAERHLGTHVPDAQAPRVLPRFREVSL